MTDGKIPLGGPVGDIDGEYTVLVVGPATSDITPWADRVQAIDAEYVGTWELPVLGEVTAPTAVLIRPDGYVAWVGDGSQVELTGALTTWFGAPAVSHPGSAG